MTQVDRVFDKREKLLYYLAIFCIITGFLISIIFIFRLGTFYSFLGSGIDMPISGQTGDFFGGVIGSIWSFSGVLLFFIALNMQRRELREQIAEQKETRLVFIHQKFDNTFFHLLSNHNNIKNMLELNHKKEIDETSKNWPGPSPIPISFFDSMKYDLKKYYDEFKEGGIETLGTWGLKIIEMLDYNEEELEILYSKDIDRTKLSYLFFYTNNQNELGHYFRNLYHLLKLIKDTFEEESSQIKDKNDDQLEKIRSKFFRYASLIQAQLSTSELLLLFYNGLLFQRMKELTEYFNFLENLPAEELLEKKHETYYNLKLKRRSDLLNLI